MLYNCKVCKRENLLSDEMCFSMHYAMECKLCRSNKWKEFRRTPEGKRHTRNKAFKNKYGITLDQYEKMLIDQFNACLICRDSFDTCSPEVDHNHKTGKVRGILCHRCNITLGYLREDEDIIWNMLEYIKKDIQAKRGDNNVPTVQ